MNHFQKLMGPDARYRYWLRFFRIPATRLPVKLVAYSKRELTKFWQFSSLLQGLVARFLFAQALFLMTMFAASYMVVMQKYRDQFGAWSFWTILIVRNLQNRGLLFARAV